MFAWSSEAYGASGDAAAAVEEEAAGSEDASGGEASGDQAGADKSDSGKSGDDKSQGGSSDAGKDQASDGEGGSASGDQAGEKKETDTASGEKAADKEDKKDKEDKAKDKKKKKEKVKLEYQELKATPEQAPLSKKNGKASSDLKRVRKFWRSLTGRKASVRNNNGTDRKAPVKIVVEGEFPEGSKLDAKYIEFNEKQTHNETGLAAFDITIRDKKGKAFIPKGPITVTVKGRAVGGAADDGDAMLIYSYVPNKERAAKYGKKYAADVLVFRDGNVENSRREYKKYKSGKKAVRYREDKAGMGFDGDNSLIFDYTYGKNTGKKAAKKNIDGTLHFVLSAQVPENTVSAADGDTEVSVTGALADSVSLDLGKDDEFADAVNATGGVRTVLSESIALTEEEAGKFNPDRRVRVSITDPAFEKALKNAEKEAKEAAEETGKATADDKTTDEKAKADDNKNAKEKAQAIELKLWKADKDGKPVLVKNAKFDGDTVSFKTGKLGSYAVTVTAVEKEEAAEEGTESEGAKAAEGETGEDADKAAETADAEDKDKEATDKADKTKDKDADEAKKSEDTDKTEEAKKTDDKDKADKGSAKAEEETSDKAGEEAGSVIEDAKTDSESDKNSNPELSGKGQGVSDDPVELVRTATDGKTYKVTVKYDTDSGIPDKAMLEVKEIRKGDFGYNGYIKRSAEEIGTSADEVELARAFDITFRDPVTRQEYQPTKDIQVSIELLHSDISEAGNVDVVHFGDKKVEVMDSEVNDKAVEFESNGFSVYVVMGYTVDFHWGYYIYSIAGESSIKLSELFEKLGITQIGIEDVEDVNFSNEKLVKVEKTDGDWLLTSLKAFKTDEKLTLKLKNGESVDIKVTDDTTIIGSWPCGATENDDVTCTLYSNGEMVVSGTGAMKDYTRNDYWVKDTPWYEYIKDNSSPITKVIVSDGVTRVGTNAFCRARNLENIDASNCTSLISIGESAFKMDKGTTALKTANFTDCINLTTIDPQAFRACVNLETVYFSGCVNLGNIAENANIFTACNAINYLDISDTQMSNIGAFNTSKTAIQTLKANNCSKFSGNLNLSAYSGLQTVELSGCTELTGLSLPSSVTTLDISGCTKLDSLNLSACNNLTTVKLGNRDDLTDLSWLTLPNSVTTLDVSGFTSLTSVDVPASVTSLDVSGCTSLTTLDASACANLTSLNVTGCTSLATMDLSGCTSLTSIEIPASVTSLDVSGCTSLTALDASSSANLTGLDVSGCTDLTTLNLSGCSNLETLNVSGCTSLTALDITELTSLSTLNAADCPDLVVYFDGEYESLPADLVPANVDVICWGDCTFAIERDSEQAIDDIFNQCNITAIESDDVESISVSDDRFLKVEDKKVEDKTVKYLAYLAYFEDPQTLTINLKNGVTGAISVVCEPLAESSNLNEFLDAKSWFSYVNNDKHHLISEESAIIKQGDKLNLNLSFSEIPEGDEGERQMKVDTMTYTFPPDLAIVEDQIHDNIVLTTPSGDISANVDFDSANNKLSITVDQNKREELNSIKNVEFSIPIQVQPDVPGDYALGNDLKLTTGKRHNAKVTISSGDYNEADKTIEYTVIVTAEDDLDYNGKEYPVEITDLTAGESSALQFVSGSGSYVYNHRTGVGEGKPESTVNDSAVTNGESKTFNGFPLNVEHMYEGDTIKLTYTAKVLRGKYNTETKQWEARNTATIKNATITDIRNPLNDTEDDQASVTDNIPYTPLVREYLTLDGSWAYWRVTVNPDSYELGKGEKLTLADTFDDDYPTKNTKTDANQSIDYSSISIKVNSQSDKPPKKVSYDYSGNTGTFRIPDSTPVIITYRTRITSKPGEAQNFRGTAVLKDNDGNQIASSTAGATGDPVVIYPSASDVGGLDNNYMVKMFVYAEGHMETGLEGAQFILLDANQRPLEYKVGKNMGQPVTFTTGSDGYVNIELNEEPGDVSIEKNTGYYLEMMKAIDGYQKDNTLYSFMITDDPSYSTGGFYQYYNGDTMKVRLYPKTSGLSVSMRFSGSYSLTEEQQNNVTAVLQKLEGENNWVEVERHPYTDSQWGAISFDEELYDPNLEYQNIYRVVVDNQHPWDLPNNIVVDTTYYCMVNTGAAEPENEPQEFVLDSADDSVSVVIDNRYEEPQLTLIKMDKKTGETLSGAEFSVYKIVNGEQTGGEVKKYTTIKNEGNQIVIRGGGPYESETLYGIKETKAPDDYLLPIKDEWHYFYFCNDEYLEPSILENLPARATAINLTETGDVITVDNQKEKITIPVMKIWQGNEWPKDAEVVIGLYKSVEGSNVEEHVLNDDGTPKCTTLTADMPYNNTAFKDLPSRDENNKNIIYSIKEEYIKGIVPTPEGSEGVDPLTAGYNPEYGTSSAGVYIVRNKPATKLTVKKEWYDENGKQITDGDMLASQSPVTFDLYRTTTPYDKLKNITNAEMTAFVNNLELVREKVKFGTDGVWSKTINDLDYQDNLGHRYYYYILEYIPSFGNESYDVDHDEGTVTIKNKIAPHSVDLKVTKAALVDDPRPEALDQYFEFTLKLQADETHPIRNWKVYTDAANSEKDLVTDENGEVSFKLKPTNPDQTPTPGASITLSLPEGVTAAVTEKANPEYTVETSSDVSGGTKADDGRTFSYRTSSENAEITYTNTLHVICKVVTDDGEQVPFESLKSALKHIRENSDDFTKPWTIYLLEDYTIPVTDVVGVREYESLTLTTATTDDQLFPYKPRGGDPERATITRGGIGGSMLKNAGTLTLDNICLDGNKDNYYANENGGLVNSTGTLNLNDKTTLRNSATSGKGGAVYAVGEVNIVDGDGVFITDNSAPNASALYLKGTLNMTGGSITGNTGASDGAVVVETTSDAINLSNHPVIFNNTNRQGKAANLYIGVDSDNAVNVVAPGLDSAAHIGISAMEGHMLIGEQFATAEFEQTKNLNRFINDEYGYSGKLKDGTSTNIVWDGLKINIKKIAEPVGANPNDRFTITLASSSIIMSTYVIDGTLDYTVTAARQGRPGTIKLSNVKAGDKISISPLPVGEYKITEEAPNYSQTYTITEKENLEVNEPIIDGKFNADTDCTVTVTNTRKLAGVNLKKTLDDRLEIGNVNFNFTVQLTEADGTAVSGFNLSEGITTNTNGEARFTMSPTDAADVIENFQAPVGATMTITETVDPNYRITTSGVTMPGEGERKEIPDLDEDNDNIYKFEITEDGADVTFNNVRKMAEIELSKVLSGKVSKEESFTFTLTLRNRDNSPVANYDVYKDEEHQENNITTDDDGKASVTFKFEENNEENNTDPDTDPKKSIMLTIPEGTKLEVAETDLNGHNSFYTTKYSINGASEKNGTTATIDKVKDSDKSIVFNNTRKTNTIVVKNTVNGYSGNVVPFSYTATVTDGEENDYDDNGFEDGVMTFELTTGQTQTLSVPYGATLKITEQFIVGYETTVKRGSATAVTKLSDEFIVTTNIPSSSPLLFTNKQLIGLQLVNNTSSDLANVKITVDKNKIYRVNDDQTDQDLVGSNKTATIRIAAGDTAILEIEHDTSTTAMQNYTVEGTTTEDNYLYTIVNEPSFHEYADPAILRVYDADKYTVKGKLRYSVNDSIVTFTEQPLVSFDSNGGSWTTEMEGYNDRDGDRKVYQKAVNTGDTVDRPSPDPVYPTDEGITFLGWTADEAFAKVSHTAEEDVSAKLFKFNSTEVNEPLTLYAIWSKPDRDYRVVTVRNKHAEQLSVKATLTKNGEPVEYEVFNDHSTNTDGEVNFNLPAGESKNLAVPDTVKLEFTLEETSLAVSSEFEITTSSDSKEFTIASVNRDGTVTFTPGICKITDEDGNLLYNNNGRPAVYPTLKSAFTDYSGNLYSEPQKQNKVTPAAVKMLVDVYSIDETTPIAFPSATMTLTTARKDDAQFPYAGVRDRSTIYRTTAGASANCFTLSSGNITLTDIILDGGSENGVKIAKTVNGGLINMTAGVLNVSTGSTLRNCEFAAYDAEDTSRGGAIYLTNGSLNVNNGLFSNLHSRCGGAICAETSAILSVTGNNGGIAFENCTTKSSSDNKYGGDGGAIFYNNKNSSKNLVINGGSDKSNPGIIFTGCVAGSDWGDGGAIFADTNYINDVTINGCSFTECSAKNTTGASDGGYGGGAIGAQKVLHLTVSSCNFTACDTLKSGGAVMSLVKSTNSTVETEKAISITDCSFSDCSCKAQGGGIAVYTSDYKTAKQSTTKLYVEGCTFANCSSGTDNGSGGAVQCYLSCMQYVNTNFTDCWAGKEGGAVNHYYGNGYTDVWTKSKTIIDGCRFIRCRAEDRYDPTALQHYGGGMNTKAKTVEVKGGSYFKDCVSTLKEGGALHLGGQGTDSTATISGSTFINCAAKNGGGALLSSHETLTITGCKFYGCESSASNGGAVYHYKNSRGDSTQKNLTIQNSTFSDNPDISGSEGCSAGLNGGAVWTRATTNILLENLTIKDCSAGNNGGGVYLVTATNATADKVKITDGSISGCQAKNGSAVYVEDQATFSGSLSVSGNTVSDINSGAIQAADTGKLYFEDNVKVENNTCSADPTDNHDVLMQNDNVTTIYTTSKGLDSGAHIGVYVPDQYFNGRGVDGTPFGTYGDSEDGSNYLDAFFNDRDSELYGCQNSENENDKNIYWGFFVCKITDGDGNLLKRANGRDAVYQRLSMALDEFTTVTGGQPVYIKMLVENYEIRQEEAISNFPAADVTLTTASKSDLERPYRGTEGTLCTISRTNSGNELFKLTTSGATFQTENITLDGRKDKTAESGNYRLITATNGSVVINGGTTLQYGKADNNGGGAINATNDATVTVNGSCDENQPTVKFVDCTANGGNGGAIRAYNLNIFNTAEETDKYGTAFINCSADNGGAITSLGSSMEINDVLFDGCHTTSGGGAVYHNNHDAGTSTTVKNCAFENCFTSIGNNLAHGGAIEARTATLNVEDSSFMNCKAGSDGGAVYHGFVDSNNNPSGNRENTTIKNTTFDGCSTAGTDTDYNYGGSVYTQAKTVEVTDSIIKNSKAANHGGAIYCQTDVEGSTTIIRGTSIENCSVIRTDGYGSGGAIYSNNESLTLKNSESENTSIAACIAPVNSGAIYMKTPTSVINITDGTVISGCYAGMGGAIYLLTGVTMNLTGSPEFTQNGYTTQNGSIVSAEKGACIYLEEDSRINLSGSPKFSRNILPNRDRITNGGVTDFVRQDIFMAGYASETELDTNAASIYVTGELTGDTIWVWPEEKPHKLPNEQFAKIADNVTVSDATLSHLRNALADTDTHCSNGEYLAGVQLDESNKNVYWDKMYTISFKKIDNKGVKVSEAVFTLYRDSYCTQEVVQAISADGETDTDAQGKLLAKGTVEFTSIRIGAYYMKETKAPTSFKDNETTYLVLVGTPYLSSNDNNKYLWEGDGPLNVYNAETLVARHTTDAGKFYGIFPLEPDKNQEGILRANLRANLASSSVGIVNIRNDYQAWFMKLDENGNPLPGAAFTIYTAILEGNEEQTFKDGYPKMMRWSRDGETYPTPVESADGTEKYKDIENNPLDKGLVYFRELPIGTYYLMETGYPERNGSNRRAFYKESDRVLRLTVWLDENTEKSDFKIEELKYNTEEETYKFEELSPDPSSHYINLSNKDVVCKLTDDKDNLLYVQGKHEIWEKKGGEGETKLYPAIYSTINEGFEAAQNETLVNKDNITVAEDPALKLQVLKDFDLEKPVNYESSRDLTFTTARTKQSDDDRYIFSTTRTNDTSHALIKRAYNADTSTDANEGALITVLNNADLTLQNINFNGQKTDFNGRAIHVKDGSLTINANTQFQNFRQEAASDSTDEKDIEGGAILMDDNTKLTVDGGHNRTAVFLENEVLNNRSGSAEDKGLGADGGAIAVGKDCTVSLTNAQFTGNKAIAVTDRKGNGGAVSMSKTSETEAPANLPLSNVVFKSNEASYQGGALRVAENSYLTVDNSTFINNTANEGNGGAVKIGRYGTLTFEDNVSMNNNSAENGGAVYLAKGAEMNMDDDSAITENTAKENGGGIYLYEDSKLYLSGKPNFGGTESDKGNRIGIGNNRKRQDIYIEGYLGTVGGDGNDKNDPKLAESLIVTGPLNVKKGSIWVGAEQADNEDNNHWDVYKQFAMFAGELMAENEDTHETVVKMPEDKLKTTFEAFRNASTSEEYYGTAGENIQCIYWQGPEGKRKVILRKVNSSYEPVKDKSFILFKGTNTSPYVVKQGEKKIQLGQLEGNNAPEGTTLDPMKSLDSGVIWVGELPYGWYIVQEVNPKKYFYLVIDKSGAYGTLGEDGKDKTDGYDTRPEAEAAATAKFNELKSKNS